MKLSNLLKGILFCAALAPSVTAEGAEHCPDLSLSQLHVLQHSYDRGVPHDLGYTLAAIALTESSAGVNLINYRTQDYGIYQGNVKTVCVQSGVYDNPVLCNRELTRIVQDPDVAADHAIETLLWWKDYFSKRKHSKAYEKMIRSYNAGFSFTSSDATVYFSKFRKNFHTIKHCVRLVHHDTRSTTYPKLSTADSGKVGKQ